MSVTESEAASALQGERRGPIGSSFSPFTPPTPTASVGPAVYVPRGNGLSPSHRQTCWSNLKREESSFSQTREVILIFLWIKKKNFLSLVLTLSKNVTKYQTQKSNNNNLGYKNENKKNVILPADWDESKQDKTVSR